MTFHADLLSQADHLARRETRRPKQASLRRAISAAYYALFHLLVSEASRVFVRDERLVNSINRSFGHSGMNEICKAFAGGAWPAMFDPIKGSFRIPKALQEVAQAFVDLQEARHDADYNLAKTFTRSDATMLIDRANKAFGDWEVVRKDDLARIYLASFLVWDKWNKKR